MTTILADIERVVRPGSVIPKPQAKGVFFFKGWGKRRGEHAFIYTIPNHKTPNNPYEKGITDSEWEKAADHLIRTGDFSRSWFEQSMAPCAKEGGCNFTTIGGVFELLGYAVYDQPGVYRKKLPSGSRPNAGLWRSLRSQT